MRALALALLLGASGVAAQVDPGTGLILGEGWELARAHCGACHSYRLVTAQRGDLLIRVVRDVALGKVGDPLGAHAMARSRSCTSTL